MLAGLPLRRMGLIMPASPRCGHRHGGRAGGGGSPPASRTVPMVVAGCSLPLPGRFAVEERSEEHTYELQSLMRISYAVFCSKKKKTNSDETGKANVKNQDNKMEN